MTKQIITPTSPVDLENIKKVIHEISDSMTRAESEKEYQKEAIDELSEKYDIDKKYIRTMARDYHKNEFDKKVNEMSDYEQLYESVMGLQND